MELKLKRVARQPTYTIGKLYVNGVYFCDTVEDCDRLYFGLPKISGITAIPCGRYEVVQNVYSPRFGGRSPYKEVCNGYVPRLVSVPNFEGVLMHCLTPETEILTEKGWMNLESFKQHNPLFCMTYNTQTKCAEFLPINFFLEEDYNGKIYRNDGCRVNYAVTDKHSMYVGSGKHAQSLNWGFKNADSLPSDASFITAAIKKGEELLPQQKALYRLVMATVADGYILNWSAKSSQVRFHFVKERKIQRIKKLVEEIGCNYKEFIDNEGKTHICLDSCLSEIITEILNPYRLIQKDKKIPFEVLNLKGEDLKDLVLEYLFWDGRYENYIKNNKNMVICSTNIENIKMLQAMAMLGGFRTYVKDDSGGANRNKCFALVLYEGQEIVKPSKDTYSTTNYNGKVWCVNNDNHTIFTRLNNRTVVVGNCGNSAQDSCGCILLGKNKVKGKVLESAVTWKAFMQKYMLPAKKKNEKVFITIV